ncbi:MAG: glycosyl hydrolase-related protein, partial [Bacteroidota bacterium]
EASLSVVDAKTGGACANLAVSALYTKAGQPYLRLYEFLGTALTTVRVTLGERVVRLVQVNLLHEEMAGPLETVAIPAFGIRTFRVMIK